MIIGVTRFGLFLRKTKLDEIPQLINIIKGEMRFIGPRPEVPKFTEKADFSFLFKIKPGISDYSSIVFRNESKILASLDKNYEHILNIKVQLAHFYSIRKIFFRSQTCFYNCFIYFFKNSGLVKELF